MMQSAMDTAKGIAQSAVETVKDVAQTAADTATHAKDKARGCGQGRERQEHQQSRLIATAMSGRRQIGDGLNRSALQRMTTTWVPTLTR